MDQQPPLFVESIYDALKAIVGFLGGPKVVGARLWPAKSVDDGRRQLLDCLNPDRNEKLDPEQVVLLFRLAREAGFHVAKHWLDTETGYEPSKPIDPVHEEARVASAIEAATVELKKALVMAEKWRERKPVPLAKVA